MQQAVQLAKPIKLLIYGPTFAGKTFSSLKIAVGIVMKKRGCTEDEAYKHIMLYDTEYGRGALYGKMGPYYYIAKEPPYTTESLMQDIIELNALPEIDVIIIDSLTHYWSKDGGILDQKAAKDKQGGNSYTNWQEFTAKFNKMLDALLASSKHIIVTARAKSDTTLTVDSVTNKSVPKTFGLKPELRDGIEFEFDVVLNIDKSTHTLLVDKGAPYMERVYDPATPLFGQMLYDVFMSQAIAQTRSAGELMTNLRKMAKDNNMISFMQLILSGRKLDDLSMDELVKIETDLITEIKKQQPKK
jgi:hypothetical protein